MRTCLLVTLCVLGNPGHSTLLAHPGHGHPEVQNGLMHYVLSPVHSVPVLCTAMGTFVVIAAAAGISRWKRRAAGKSVTRTSEGS